MMELEWLKDCAIPLEEERPSELMDITADYQLVSNSDRTKSLKVFRHSEYSSKKYICLLYTSPSPRDLSTSRMPSSA